ncbi:MAG: hypothetical protein AABX23_04035 [Nanoarchaeota archaeon]
MEESDSRERDFPYQGLVDKLGLNRIFVEHREDFDDAVQDADNSLEAHHLPDYVEPGAVPVLKRRYFLIALDDILEPYTKKARRRSTNRGLLKQVMDAANPKNYVESEDALDPNKWLIGATQNEEDEYLVLGTAVECLRLQQKLISEDQDKQLRDKYGDI